MKTKPSLQINAYLKARGSSWRGSSRVVFIGVLIVGVKFCSFVFIHKGQVSAIFAYRSYLFIF